MRNHYVPQFLQRPWTDDKDGKLEVYHIVTNGVHVTRKVPKGAGYKEDMLSLTRESIAGMGRHDIEEIVLKQVDNDAALIRDKLQARRLGDLSHEERCAWVRFIMSLRIRDPQIVSGLIADSDQELRRSLRDDHDEYGALADGEDPPSLEAWTERHFPGLIENFGLSFFHELLNDDKVGNKLLHLKWWVFDVSPASACLLLGDRPAIFFGGIDDPNFAVALPISPSHLFLATRGAALETGLPKTSPRDLASRVNDATVRQAASYVYGRDGRSLRFITNRRGSGLLAR